MSWREQLRQASYRGARFHVETDDHTGGRRAVEHEHAQVDGVTTEDLGRQHRRISVTGFVLGPDYLAAEEALWTALHQPGPGTLILPFGPERLVQVARDGVQVSHSSRDGGQAIFRLQFVEVDPRDARPASAPDTAAAVTAAADAAGQAEIDWFGERFTAADEPGWVQDELAGRLAGMLGGIDGAFGRAGMLTGKAHGYRAQLDSLLGGGSTLFGRPRSLLESLRGLFRSAPGAGGGGAFRAGQSLWRSIPAAWPAAAPATTATRVRQGALQQLLTDSVARTALVEAARAVPAMRWDSADAALADRDALAAALDQAQMTSPDALYRPLTGLRAAVVRDVGARAAALAPLARRSLPATRPALAVAHDLYGDTPLAVPDLAGDVVSRNRLRHPLFVPGGAELEVLARA